MAKYLYAILALFAFNAFVANVEAQDKDVPLSELTLVPIDVQSPPPAKYLDPANIKYQTGPSIAVAPNGRIWVAIMTGGRGEDNDNYIDLITSGDGGKTWSLPKFSLDIDGPVRTFDPAMWTDPLGRVWVFWCQVYDFWDGRGGLWTMVCDDPDNENAKWSAPRRLCDGVMKNKPTVLKNGDWWMCVEQWQDNTSAWHWDEIKKQQELPEWYVRSDHIGCNVYRSQDRGETWEYLSTAPVPQDVRTCDEHMIVEREDGSFYMTIRTLYGRGECESFDGGKTWTEVVPSKIKNMPSRIFMGKLKSGNVLLVKNGELYDDPDPEDAKNFVRSNIVAFLSEDDGKTFPYRLELDMRRNVSYPDVSQTEDGTLYSVHDYLRYGDGAVLLDIFTEEDIKAGKIVSNVGKIGQIVRTHSPK